MNDTTFDEVFALMEASFPVCEIRTYARQRALLDLPHYRLIVEKDASGRTIAFLACWEFPLFRFVEHIAVDQNIRGGGIGKKLMEDYIKQSDKPVLLEVEPPSGVLEQRRVAFYKRLGFHLHSYPYVQPPLREGQADLPLLIMTYPRLLQKQEFQLFREILYTEVYKVNVPYKS